MKYLNLLLLALMFGWIVLPGNNVVNTDKLISFSPYASRGVRCIGVEGSKFWLLFNSEKERNSAIQMLIMEVNKSKGVY